MKILPYLYFTISHSTLAFLYLTNCVLLAIAHEEGENLSIVGAGSYHDERLIKRLSTAFLYGDPHHQIEYTSLSIEKALCRLLDAEIECKEDDITEPHGLDFVFSEIPINQNISLKYNDILTLPFAATPVVPIYNLPTLPTNYSLVLDPSILSRIYPKCNNTISPCPSDTIHSWSHPDIIALNPSVKEELVLAGDIISVVHQGVSGITYIMKSFLQDFAKNKTDFTNQIPIDGSDDWGSNSNLIKKVPQEKLYSFISLTPSSLGYDSYSEIVDENHKTLKTAYLMMNNKLNIPIQPNYLSSKAAVSEMGVIPLLNNNENENLITPLWSGKGLSSWPIIGYTYLMIREQTTKEGGSCSTRAGLLEFFSWIYEDDEVDELIKSLGFVPVNEDIASLSHKKLQNIECENGKKASDENAEETSLHLVYVKANVFSVNFSNAISSIIQSTVSTHNQLYPDNQVTLIETKDPLTQVKNSIETSQTIVGAIGIVASADIDKDLEENRDSYVALPFAAVAGGVVYNLCGPDKLTSSCEAGTGISLKLSLETIADIINGEITMWNDYRIAKYLTRDEIGLLPNKTIQVVKPIQGWEDTLANVFTKATSGKKTLTYSAASIEPGDEKQVLSLVSILPYSFALIPVFDIYAANYAQVILQNPVSLNMESIENCTSNAYDMGSKKFIIDQSLIANTSGCYPIIIPIYAIMRKSFTENECINNGGQSAAKFMQFLYGLLISDFYLGFEEYDIETGEPLYSEDEISPYQEVINLRNAREGIKTALEHWGMVSLVAPHVKQGTTHLRASYMIEMEKLNCDGKSIVGSSPNLNEISLEIRNAAYIIYAIALFIVFCVALWVIRYRKERLIANNSPKFLIQILLGAALGLSAIPLFPIDDSSFFNVHMKNGVSEQIVKELSLYCNLSMWFLGIGYSIMVSALFVKMWRIVTIFNNKRLVIFNIKDRLLLGLEFIPVIAIVIFLAIAQSIAPQQYSRKITSYNAIDGSIIESSGSCTTNNLIIAYVPFFVFIILSLIYGNYVAYKSRNIPSQYSEGKWIAVALALMLIAFLFGIPVIILASNNPTVLCFAKMAIVFVVYAIAPCFLFVPKFLIAYGYMQSDNYKMSPQGVQINGGDVSMKFKKSSKDTKHQGNKTDSDTSPNASNQDSNQDLKQHTPRSSMFSSTSFGGFFGRKGSTSFIKSQSSLASGIGSIKEMNKIKIQESSNEHQFDQGDPITWFVNHENESSGNLIQAEEMTITSNNAADNAEVNMSEKVQE